VEESRVRPTPAAFLALAWLLIINVADRVQVGPVSLSGLLTLATVGVAGFLALTALLGHYEKAGFARPPRRAVPLPLTLFTGYAVLTLVRSPSSEAVQNVTVYLAFALTLGVTGRLCNDAAADRLLQQIRTVAWIVAAVYLATVLHSGLDASTVYEARPVALTAVVLVAVAVASRPSQWLSLALLLVVFVSLSRTASLLAIFVFALGLAVRSSSRGRALRVFVLLIAAAGGAWIAFTQFAPLRNRFFGGDQALDYGGAHFNLSGRSALWEFTLKSAEHHLWLGAGPGTAEVDVTREFVTVSHPHNDYLRLLHDFGILGTALFLLALLLLVRRTWRLGRRSGRPVHWAAFLALLGVAGCAVTDNVLVYPFVMVPLGVLVGASLSAEGTLDEAPEESPVSARGTTSGLTSWGSSASGDLPRER
jgi:O-antigen ligase